MSYATGSLPVFGIAMSYDGTRIYFVTGKVGGASGKIYKSSNTGSTWTTYNPLVEIE